MDILHAFNAESAINSFGLAGIFLILFVETGLPIVIGLPGDSLLFMAGLAASGTGAVIKIHISLRELAIGAPLFAIAGSQFGHWLGYAYGSKLFGREDSKYFNPKKLKTLQKWIDKYGIGKMIIPVVRHLVNPAAGVAKMSYKKFFLWNATSALVWTQGFIWGGYVLGEKLKGSVDKYVLPIVAVIVIVSIAPIFWEIFKEWRTRRHLS
jgi:membrane-associated protein